MTTTTAPRIGQMIRIDQPNGDSYIGEVHNTGEAHPIVGASTIELRDYSAWYVEADEPFNSHPDDTVLIGICNETRICVFEA